MPKAKPKPKPKKLIRRNASLKGWRTRARMKEARKKPEVQKFLQTARENYHLFLDRSFVDAPAYMRRALPNPWLK